MKIYENIKHVADERHISINQLEKDAGIARGTICKWNTSSPSVNNVKKISDILKCDIREIIK